MRSVKEKVESLPAVVFHPTKRSCAAFGCPEIGAISSTNAGPAPTDSWFCRFHFGESSDRWGDITRSRRIFWDNYREQEKEQPEVTPQYIAMVRSDLARFAKSFGSMADPKGWARKLKAREEAGEHLLDVQAKAWRAALRWADAEPK